jgi:hypothetical protein
MSQPKLTPLQEAEARRQAAAAAKTAKPARNFSEEEKAAIVDAAGNVVGVQIVIPASATGSGIQTLSSDPDGLGPVAIQWLRGGQAIAGATGASYTLVQTDVGTAITVRLTQTDGFGSTDSIVATGGVTAVVNVNDLMTGTVGITNSTSTARGTSAARQGDTLSAEYSLADDDGLEDGAEIVEYLTEHSVRVHINTNGSTRTPDWWARLARAGVSIGFALDGLADTHHLHRQDTDWYKVIANAEAFIAAGGRAVWRFAPFDHNRHQEDACKKLLYNAVMEQYEIVIS